MVFLSKGILAQEIPTVEEEEEEGECSVVLKEAQKMYDDGKIETIPQFLQNCLTKADGFTKEERVQAYRLMVLSYLFQDNKVEAEKHLLTFFKLEPEYVLNPAVDPAEFIKLYQSYRNSPVYSIGAFGGINYSLITVIEPYSSVNTTEAAGEYTNSSVGFQAGIRMNRYLFKRTELNLEVCFLQNTFSYTNKILGTGELSVIEQQQWIYTPLMISHDINERRIRPFMRLGAAVGFLMAANATEPGIKYDNKPDVEGATIKLKDIGQRNKMNYWAIGSIGAKMKVKRGAITAELRYNAGLTSQVDPNMRFTYDAETNTYNGALEWDYKYQVSDFVQNHIAFNAGYVYQFYKPKKKKTKD
jgi:hypothetical protein